MVEVITDDRFVECLISLQSTMYNARWKNNALQTML